MDSTPLTHIDHLSSTHRSDLKKANILTVSDLILTPPKVISQKCRLAPLVVQSIIDTVCQACRPIMLPLSEILPRERHYFTTGEPLLDKALGLGICTSMLWEVVGESAAAKSQLALQLSLSVQLPLDMGGLSGCACFITTSASLPTTRLVEMLHERPAFQGSACSMNNVHTIEAPTTHILSHVLKNTLPSFIANKATSRPVKLLVIDAIAELFHLEDKTSTKSLVDRSRELSELSGLLHSLATTHRLAVLAVNEVSEAFMPSPHTSPGTISNSPQMIYNEHAKSFNQVRHVPGGSSKEARLGLVWANQVNARIFLHRTNRRIHISKQPSKRRRLNENSSVEAAISPEQDTLLRRLSVVYSSVGPPTAVDYIVTGAGIIVQNIVEDALSSLPTHDNLILDIPAPSPTAAVHSDLVHHDAVQLESAPSQTLSPAPHNLNPLDFGEAAAEKEAEATVPSSQDDEAELLLS